jgi:hypothetical protein
MTHFSSIFLGLLLLVSATDSVAQEGAVQPSDAAKKDERGVLPAAEKPAIQNDPMLSSLNVSPAQSWQITEKVAFFGYAILGGTFDYATDAIESSTDVGGAAMVFSFVAPVPSTKLHAGLSYNSWNTSATSVTENITGEEYYDKSKGKYEGTQISPFGSYAFTENISLGVQFRIINAKDKPNQLKSETHNYNAVDYGVTYHERSVEVGLYYTPTININESGSSETEAGSLMLHAQKRISSNTLVGGNIDYQRYKDLDDEVNKNVFAFTLASDVELSSELLVGVNASYRPSYVDEKLERDPFNIAATSVGAFGRYRSGQASLGIGYNFERTGEQSGGVEIEEKIEDTTMSGDIRSLFFMVSYAGF